jgi:HSP20 family protein
LPNTVDIESISANYEKGVLKVRLAKKAEAKPKQIKVNVGGEKTLEGRQQPGSTQPKSAGQAA